MRKKIRYYVLIIAGMIIVGNLISFILNPSLVSSPRAWLINCLFSVGVGLPMMKFSEFIVTRFGNKIRWEVNPGRRIAVTLGAVIVAAILVTFLINYIFVYNVQGESFTEYIKVTLTLLLLQVLIVVYAFSLITAIQFFRMWKEGLMKQEALQRRTLELKLEALRNQVNPHFLFNSLNMLASLVPRDQDMAVKMIMNLSDSYRYLLDQRDQKLVEWPVERTFVENWLSLQQMRFADNLRVHITPGDWPVFYVVPLAVQMLVENAVKHNTITSEEPLEISIYAEEGYLVVRNNLQVRSTVERTSNAGLENIKQQYEILTGMKVEVKSDDGFFTVRLPCIYKPLTS
ncbi:MAG: histidine kinase [Bacteroidales bacterium]|nr:histidine kinase [Bacteroidales bacterium]